MKTRDSGVPSVVRVANRIVADIRRRRLKPGDAYLTTAETARLLGVSTTAANRAMQLLVQRQLLDRRQRKGTTLATPVAETGRSALRRVHVLVNRRHVETEGVFADGMLIGIQSQLPGADIGFHFLPEGNEPAEIDRLVRAILATGDTAGLVLMRASLAAQRALVASGLPVVLAGRPYPSIRGLAFVDRDHEQIGRLLAEYLLQQKVQRVLVVMRDRMQQGDHIVVDKVRDTLAEAGLPLTALTLRCLPSDAVVAADEIGLLLDALPGPVGVLCRGTPLADAARTAIAGRSFRPGQRPVIAVCDIYGSASQHPIYPHARPVIDAVERGACLGRLLACQACGERPDPDHELIPVELALPAT
jgi:DNA-binding LacI/PurR family transcriptional regulator